MEFEIDKANQYDTDKCILRLDEKGLKSLGIKGDTIVELVPNADKGFDVIPQPETEGKIDTFPTTERPKNTRLFFVLRELFTQDQNLGKVRIDEQDRDALKVDVGQKLKLHKCEEWEIPDEGDLMP